MAKKKAKKKKTKKATMGLWSKSEVALLKKLFSSNPTAKIAKRLEESIQNGTSQIEEVYEVPRQRVGRKAASVKNELRT